MDNDDEVREVALDVVCTLPARTAPEIALILHIVDKTQDEQVQNACAFALQRAQPLNEAAWDALDHQSKNSSVQVIREMAEAVIKRRKRPTFTPPSNTAR